MEHVLNMIHILTPWTSGESSIMDDGNTVQPASCIVGQVGTNFTWYTVSNGTCIEYDTYTDPEVEPMSQDCSVGDYYCGSQIYNDENDDGNDQKFFYCTTTTTLVTLYADSQCTKEVENEVCYGDYCNYESTTTAFEVFVYCLIYCLPAICCAGIIGICVCCCLCKKSDSHKKSSSNSHKRKKSKDSSKKKSDSNDSSKKKKRKKKSNSSSRSKHHKNKSIISI
eukprot:Mrub_05689.p1 GENE.Mrub_05689~~Mrub_05689.p1  ORF type:complete len:224 (-),score=14.00 Mrub_05689:38-709(-)